MTDTEIQKKISLLSEEQKEALLKFLDKIVSETPRKEKDLASKRKKAYGFMKGKIEVKEGFDDPVDEFFDPIDPK